MDQREFLSQLIEELKYLKPKDANEVVKFYQQKIAVALDYGEKEEKIIASFPTPKKIAEDIYKTKGIAYIDLRKKEMKRQSVFNFVGAIIISLIITLIFSYVTYLFTSMSINLFSIIFQTNSFVILDKITLIITSILILLIELVVYIYFIDLCYSMIMYFISGPFYQLKNKKLNEKITDFTISGFLNKITKKEKLLLKVAIVLVFITLVSGITNYATKGYLYRSGANIASTKEEYVVSNKNINKIKYNGSLANFTITSDDTVEDITILYYHEFKHDFKLNEDNNVLEISFTDNKNLDFLNLLKEPTQVVVIKIPTSYQLIDIELSVVESNINFISANLGNVKITNNVGTYQIYDSKIKSLDIKTNKGIVQTLSNDDLYKNKNNEIVDLVLDILNGEVELKNIFGEKCKLINSTAKFDIDNLKYDNLIINSSAGELLINELQVNSLIYETKSTMCTLSNSKINKVEAKVVATSSLTINNTIISEEITSIVTGSYLILEFVKTPSIKVTSASSATIYLYNLSEKIEKPQSNINSEYNELDIATNITIANSENSKIAIYNNCIIEKEQDGKKSKELVQDLTNIKTLEIQQKQGTISIKESKISNMNLNLDDVNVQIEDVYGNPYEITMKSGYLTYNNYFDTGQILNLHRNITTQVEISNNIKKVE